MSHTWRCRMRWILGGLLILCLPSLASSQSISMDPTKDPIVTPAPVDVRNRDTVTADITHVPVVECKVETKPEPLNEEANPLSLVLQAATKVRWRWRSCKDCDKVIVRHPQTMRTRRSLRRTARLAEIMDGLETSTGSAFKIYQAVATRLRAFARCREVIATTGVETRSAIATRRSSRRVPCSNKT